VTTAELVAKGLSEDRIRSLVRTGALVRVGRGAYVRSALAEKVQGSRAGAQAMSLATVLARSQPGVVGSHESAAIIHGLDLLGRRPSGLTVTHQPGAGSAAGRAGVRVHVAALPTGHVVRWSGVPVTSVARTVVDLARTSSFRAGVVTADSALRKQLTTRDELTAVLAGCARWPGLARAREVVEFSDALSESALESLSRVVFREQKIPPPELQQWVGGDNGVVGRADFLWRRFGTIGEADGAIKYADSGSAIAQLRRDARLRQAGFEVVHFTWDDIVRTPAYVAASLREAFRRGAAGGQAVGS
jgi:Transcriptional regulator, AbiEi antitoxin/AbiEi antitoxin C-terminal domain